MQQFAVEVLRPVDAGSADLGYALVKFAWINDQ
jgi:hypothetical protein